MIIIPFSLFPSRYFSLLFSSLFPYFPFSFIPFPDNLLFTFLPSSPSLRSFISLSSFPFLSPFSDLLLYPAYFLPLSFLPFLNLPSLSFYGSFVTMVIILTSHSPPPPPLLTCCHSPAHDFQSTQTPSLPYPPFPSLTLP